MQQETRANRPPVRRPDDAGHLKILAICHFVYAGLNALSSCIPIVYFNFFGGLFAFAANDQGDPAAATIGWVFVFIGGLITLLIWTITALIAFAGRNLLERRGRLYCVVVAALMCINVPLGTVLGVFTLIVLSRPSVRILFGET